MARLGTIARFVVLLLKADVGLLRTDQVPAGLALRLIAAKYQAVIRQAWRRPDGTASVPIGRRRFHYDSLSSLVLLQTTFAENAYLADIVPPGGVVVDIGANVGQFRLFSEEVLRAGRVVSVEPVQRTFDALQRNFPHDVCRCAVGASGQVTLYVDERFSTRTSSERRTDRERPEVVPASPLDDLDALRGESAIDLLKIDTEGSELDVLRSGLRAVRRSAFLLVELSLSRPATGRVMETLHFLHREVPELELIRLGHSYLEGGVAVAVDGLFANRARAVPPSRPGDRWRVREPGGRAA